MYYLGSATYQRGGPSAMCNSSSDSCSLSGLQCGVQYFLSVRALTKQCASDLSVPVNITTEPCQVQNLIVTGSCTSNTLQLNWSNANGALRYTISVSGNLGYTNTFQRFVNSLQVEVSCGQSYTFSVLGNNDQCQSLTSATAKFSTAPCVPIGVNTFIQCEDNIASISWTGSDGAVSYTAVAEGQTLGGTYTCTSNTTVCTWTNLSCGETYIARVVANDLRCRSIPSNNTTIRMAPCIPQILNTTMDCSLRVASLTWISSQAAQSYVVTAENNIGQQVGQTTNTTIAQFSDLQCGQQYYFKVLSVGQGCRSSPSNTSVLQTDPCPPTAVSTSVDCISNIATVTWGISNTANYYMASMVGPDGKVTTCMSSTTSCGVATLQCGQKYNVSVTASRQLCNSKPSSQTNFNTAPCVPLGVSVVMDCTKNEARVSWNASLGAQYYLVYATSKSNDYAACNSSGINTYCTLKALTCGAVYTVKVVAVGNDCSSLPSQPVDFGSVPCRPDIASVQLNCTSSLLSLNWTSVGSAVYYTVFARAPPGQNSSCTTNSTSCELRQLDCGQIYSITMTASNNQCSSNQSTAVQAASAPCPLVWINSSMNCQANSAQVQWDRNGAAESYEVQALGTRGYMTGCNTTGTFCNVSNLLCGDVYNISVFAINNKCRVRGYPVLQLRSVPCVPAPLSPTLNCTSGAVTMTWQPSSGATFYRALAQGSGGFPSSCNSNSTTCVFTGLLCGLNYSFTVSASDSTCTSLYSNSVQLNTVPCKPQFLSALMDCWTGTGLVSWEAAQGVLSYLVQAVGANGTQAQCSTTNTNCSLLNLNCGQLYTLTAVGQDGRCNSSAAQVNLQSGT
ncbi:fibronectin type III domain-containing protein 7-like [Tachysurus vachellii]|uniref:fibronectin type III domain-containing protein 7-like n=1 Tax=Tachysurus vachellii TaxID=175792 RepID=UPI00296AD446|nr:fibronectin type III domain-containing protein 7-like [Tachysurus vachellii]